MNVLFSPFNDMSEIGGHITHSSHGNRGHITHSSHASSQEIAIWYCDPGISPICHDIIPGGVSDRRKHLPSSM